MFKKLLLLGTVIALVPMDRDNQQAVFDTASAVVTDLGDFCTRNPQVCDRGSIMVSQFKAKASFAGGLVYEMVKDQARNEDDQMEHMLGHSGQTFEQPRSPAPIAGENRFPSYAGNRPSESRVVGSLRRNEAEPYPRGGY